MVNTGHQYWNLPVAALVEETLARGQGVLNDTGALGVGTGRFTGRAPKDQYVVRDAYSENKIWWGSVNNPISPGRFEHIFTKMKLTLLPIRCLVFNTLPGYPMFLPRS